MLMGVGRLAQTAVELVSAGHDPETPTALVESGYRDEQRVTVGTLETIAARAEAIGAQPPAITIIGDVVTLSPAWPPA
jgi:uroporphyrin-III C-methyltransferase/precorrin-2 dehydrogenase/sirohydrochlorin ferrochelatase